jgi:hypothetical protein
MKAVSLDQTGQPQNYTLRAQKRSRTIRLKSNGASDSARIFGTAAVIPLRYPVLGLAVCCGCLIAYLKPEAPD